MLESQVDGSGVDGVPQQVPATMTASAALDLVLQATGRGSLEDAVTWIADGLNLKPGADLNRLLQALAVLNPGEPGGAKALTAIARQASRSDLDSAAMLFRPESITSPLKFRSALDLLAAHSPEKRLANIDAGAVIAAQRANPFAMQVLCAVAGLSYNDLEERVAGLPSEPTASWTPTQIRNAFALIDDVVSGRVTSELPGTIATGPIELMPSVVGKVLLSGWEAIEGQLRNGVPYEVLLAQRVVGGTWLAHRNATSGLLNHSLADRLCDALDAASIPYRRSTSVGGEVAPGTIQELAGSDKQVGVVVLGKGGQAAYTVAFSSARDSGTARKSAASLGAMTRDAAIPMAVVLAGPGWSHRNETAELAIAFDGRLFSDAAINALMADIRRVLGVSDPS